MVNNAANNPIFIDTVGLVTAGKTKITGISVRASGDTWVATLHDAEGGDIIFDQESAVANDRGGYFPINVWVTGIYATTLTDITNVLVYTDGVP